MKKKSNTLVIGMRPVIETLLGGQPISKIYIHQGAQDRSALKELLLLAKKRSIPCVKVPLAYLKRLTSKNHQGAIALISPIPFVDITHVVQQCYEKGNIPLIVLLDRVQDVRNLGAIARTALSMGVDTIVIPKQGSALIGEDAMKTSAGALNHLPIARVDELKSTITYLKESGLQILACDEKASKPITEANLTLPTALLFGGEAQGINAVYRTMADEAFLIPMQGPIASLNVSVAASIILYESVRQRTNFAH